MPEAAGPEVATGASLLDELILAYMPENLGVVDRVPVRRPWARPLPARLLRLSTRRCRRGRCLRRERSSSSPARTSSRWRARPSSRPRAAPPSSSSCLAHSSTAASIFVVGAGIGFGIGALFWFLVSGHVEPGGEGLTLSGWNRFQIFLGSLVPAIAIGIIFLSWERRLMTLSAVIIGAGLMLFGLRYSGLPLGVREWTPLLAGAAIAAGLWLSLRRENEQAEQQEEPNYYYP